MPLPLLLPLWRRRRGDTCSSATGTGSTVQGLSCTVAAVGPEWLWGLPSWMPLESRARRHPRTQPVGEPGTGLPRANILRQAFPSDL